MNIREAILRAADSIEQNPDLFDFDSIVSPDPDCGTPGCALGWIYHHYSGGVRFDAFSYSGQHSEFFNALGVQKHTCAFPELSKFVDGWRSSAKRCAKALRMFADKYHPIPKTGTNIPKSVLDIFRVSEAA